MGSVAVRSSDVLVGLTPMTTPAARESDRGPVVLRLLAWLVLALMASATVYTAWIAVANFHRIGV